MSAEDALAEAWATEGTQGNGDPTGVHLTYALLTWGDDYAGRMVWVITYEGLCIPIGGGVGAADVSARGLQHVHDGRLQRVCGLGCG